jgi:hypothetical protein
MTTRSRLMTARAFTIWIAIIAWASVPDGPAALAAAQAAKTGGKSAGQPPFPAARKTPRILAHYMPWYMAKPHSQIWGWHWTMGTFDPESRANARPNIASHYHPIIGPYDSADPDVLEYHGLLMKLAGIDGVVVDWYGTVDYLDYGINHRNTALFLDQAGRTGLDFAVCYEDETIPRLIKAGRLDAGKRVDHARHEISWLAENWFARPSYLKLGGQAVLLSFGQSGLSNSEWQDVVAGLPAKLVYLSEHERRNAAAGAFDWPSPRNGPSAQDEFYKKAARWPVGMAVAYPRFHDIYEQAKVHPSWGNIADDNGKTFTLTLTKALQSGLPFVQISTWNDWGEGTIIEPSIEFGYRDLEIVQHTRRQFIDPDFAGKPEDLRLPHRLYTLRKAVKGQATLTRELDRIAQLLSQRAVGVANESLDTMERQSRNTR